MVFENTKLGEKGPVLSWLLSKSSPERTKWRKGIFSYKSTTLYSPAQLPALQLTWNWVKGKKSSQFLSAGQTTALGTQGLQRTSGCGSWSWPLQRQENSPGRQNTTSHSSSGCDLEQLCSDFNVKFMSMPRVLWICYEDKPGSHRMWGLERSWRSPSWEGHSLFPTAHSLKDEAQRSLNIPRSDPGSLQSLLHQDCPPR